MTAHDGTQEFVRTGLLRQPYVLIAVSPRVDGFIWARHYKSGYVEFLIELKNGLIA